MSSSTTIVITKKRGPKPTGKGTLIGVRLQPDLLAEIDGVKLSGFSIASRPETIRYIIRDWLERSGRL